MPENTDAFVIEIVMHSDTINEKAINRFFYASASFASAVTDVLDAFDTVVGTPLLDIMNVNSTIRQYDGNMVKGSALFGSKAVIRSGSVSGSMTPTFVAWDYTYLRGGVGERNGYKRFVGVAESSQDNGSPTTGIATSLSVVADALGQPLIIDADTWVPVIRRTRINHTPQHPPKYYDISSVAFSKIGSQNSRKPGHGR